MKYITGVHALNLPCSLETSGDWHTSALRWKDLDIRESNQSVFRNYGIEPPIEVPNNQNKIAHANHLRAILDILEEGNNLGWLKGFRNDFLCTDKYNREFMDKVIILKSLSHWSAIDILMGREFMMDWVNYKKERGIC